jgi:hypothetical protein
MGAEAPEHGKARELCSVPNGSQRLVSPFCSSSFKIGARQNRMLQFRKRRFAKFGCNLAGPVLKPDLPNGPLLATN